LEALIKESFRAMASSEREPVNVFRFFKAATAVCTDGSWLVAGTNYFLDESMIIKGIERFSVYIRAGVYARFAPAHAAVGWAPLAGEKRIILGCQRVGIHGLFRH